MTQLADAPINLVSLADPLLAEIFEYVGTPGVGKLALTCTDFRRVAGETMKTKRAAVLERIHKLTHKRDTSATYQPSDLKRLYRVMPDLLEHALADLRAWGGECREAEMVLTHATLARKVDDALVRAVENLGKPELVVKLHEDKIYLDEYTGPFGNEERSLPEGHTLLVPLLPDGVADYLESVGFSHDEAIQITAAVKGRKESSDAFKAFLAGPRPTIAPEAEEAVRKMQARSRKGSRCTRRTRSTLLAGPTWSTT